MRDDIIPPLGTLTDRVQLRRKTTTSDDEGGIVALYSPIATVWARVRQLGARQVFAEDARGQSLTHSVTMRFRTDLKPGDRIVYRGRELDIDGTANVDGRRAYLNCQCVERTVTA